MVQGNIDTRPTFYRVETTPTYGFGIGTFNASLARIWAPATDLLYSTHFNEFVSDSTRTVDITEGGERKNCVPRDDVQSGSGCLTTLFVPGGIENYVQELLESSKSIKADAYLAIDQQGYVFEFEQGIQNWKYNTEGECRVYSSELFAFALCLKNGADSALQARKLNSQPLYCSTAPS